MTGFPSRLIRESISSPAESILEGKLW